MGVGLTLLVALAQAQEPVQSIGLPIAQVEVVAVEGGLPEENLLPLLGAQQGQVLTVPGVRSDIALLYSTGAFGAVQAQVEPWFMDLDDGSVVPAVRLTYEVQTLPVVRDLELSGVPLSRRPQVHAALAVVPGQRWLTGQGELALKRRVEGLYEGLGFEGTAVLVETLEWAPGELIVQVRVVEGEPIILERLSFGEAPIPEGDLRRAARRGGLVEGRRYTARQLRDAKEELLQVCRDRGYLEARVRVVQGEREVGIFVEAGPKVVLELRDAPRGRARDVERWLALEEEVRVDRTLVPELQARVVQGLRDEGHPDASAQVEYVEGEAEDGGLEKRLIVTLQPGVAMVLDGWDFEGNTVFRDELLAAAMREASPLVLGRGAVTEPALADAADALEELYRNAGYLQVQVRVDEVQRSPGRRADKAVVVVHIQEGAPTVLHSVTVRGAAPELELLADQAARALEGQNYSPSAIRQLERDLLSAHQGLGYLQAVVDLRVELQDEGGRAEVLVDIDPGGRLYVRNLVVRGQTRTRTEVLRRELALETGDPITPEALATTREQLYELDALRAVQVELQGSGDRYRDVVVVVDEKPAWTLEGGGGLATDEGIRSFGRATRRGLWGRAHRLTVLGRVGVGYDGDSFKPSSEDLEWYAGLRYEAPNLPWHRQLLVADVVGNERLQEPTYRLARSGAGLGAQLELTETWDLTLSTRFEARWLEDLDPGALVAGDPWLEDLGSGAPRPRGELEVVSLVDRRDDPFNPTRGTLFSLQLTATDPLTTGYWSVQTQARGQLIVPVGPLGLRLDGQAGVGWVAGRGTTLPLEERYRLGGASTMRGYPLDTVGPKNELPDLVLPYPDQISGLVDYATRDEPLRWVPTGGDSMLLFTAELWVPLPVLGLPKWTSTSLVGFVDVGNVYFLDPTVFATSTVVQPEPLLRYGTGLGLRQTTPVGPLQLDLAVNPLYFTTDWAAERGEVPLRLHLSLGAL